MVARKNLINVEEQSTVLKAFSRALRREVHVLSQHPDLLWQQLYNNLQWEGLGINTILTVEKNRLTKFDPKIWMHTRSPFSESKSLLRILEGPISWVSSCDWSPDGRWIITGYSDQNLKIWDAAKGEVLYDLEGHESDISTCAFSPDGRRIISGGSDWFIKVWDAKTGRELKTLKGGAISDCAWSPDGHQTVLGCANNTLEIWDIEAGKLLQTLEGHTLASRLVTGVLMVVGWYLGAMIRHSRSGTCG